MTLLETIASTAVFLLIMAMTTALLRYSMTHYQSLRSRSDAQGELLAIKANLTPDLQRGHFRGVDFREVTVSAARRNRPGTVSARRDVLSVVTLAEWVSGVAEPVETSYGYGGIPRWNAYVVYAAGRERLATSSLTRYILQGSDLAHRALSLEPLPDLQGFDGGSTTPHEGSTLRRSKVAERLAHFEVEPDEQRQMIKVKVRVLEDSGEVTSAAQEGERYYTAVFSVRPLNTTPKM